MKKNEIVKQCKKGYDMKVINTKFDKKNNKLMHERKMVSYV
jgi:hypothetical protein